MVKIVGSFLFFLYVFNLLNLSYSALVFISVWVLLSLCTKLFDVGIEIKLGVADAYYANTVKKTMTNYFISYNNIK